MSLHRENITWQSSGKWYIGFYHCFATGDDSEWDADYDYSSFSWASGPHSTKEEAFGAWNGANPGCHTVDIDGKGRKEYDKMFEEYQNRSPEAPIIYVL